MSKRNSLFSRKKQSAVLQQSSARSQPTVLELKMSFCWKISGFDSFTGKLIDQTFQKVPVIHSCLDIRADITP